MSGVAGESYSRWVAASLDWKPCPWCQRPLQVRIKRVDTSADGQPSFIEIPDDWGYCTNGHRRQVTFEERDSLMTQLRGSAPEPWRTNWPQIRKFIAMISDRLSDYARDDMLDSLDHNEPELVLDVLDDQFYETGQVLTPAEWELFVDIVTKMGKDPEEFRKSLLPVAE